ncbi:hypothetical protein [Haloferula rosea]|uniref:Uncharacterized protein n=1 Tax=Haloferula rosea TaxID=490093 RepID=A0A934VE81_9BACT|nr:hypothetical protein [Haloferula rosea]MBK1827029.1 hypothetical protein [Haloferula rosea]
MGCLHTSIRGPVLTVVGLLACPLWSEDTSPQTRPDRETRGASAFHLQIIHQEPLDGELMDFLPKLSKEITTRPPSANLTIEMVDLSSSDSQDPSAIPHIGQVRFWPAAMLHPPASWDGATPWVFGASKGTVERIMHSPVRQRISDELMRGAPAVWCLVESGDNTADAQALELLQASMDKVNAARTEAGESSEFLIERVRRDDPAETTFLKILMGPDRRPITGPLFVPVFGHGRTTGPLPASVTTHERLRTACDALVDSTQETKAYDLLFATNWDAPEEKKPDSSSSLSEEAPSQTETPSPPQAAGPSVSRGWIAALVGGGILLLGVLSIASLKFRS